MGVFLLIENIRRWNMLKNITSEGFSYNGKPYRIKRDLGNVLVATMEGGDVQFLVFPLEQNHLFLEIPKETLTREFILKNFGTESDLKRFSVIKCDHSYLIWYDSKDVVVFIKLIPEKDCYVLLDANGWFKCFITKDSGLFRIYDDKIKSIK